MSNENNKAVEPGKTAEPTKTALSGLRSNPKILYGGIALLVVIGVLLMSGGGEEQVTIKTTVTPGQTVVLQNPNVGNTLLMGVPGKLGSADDESEESQNICVVVAGTHALVEEETVVNYIPFVKVKVLEGSCKDKSGWTSKVNIKAQ
jgi:hypothetical protein